MKTGICPLDWMKSLIISIHKKGNQQKCENYRTISFISHSSKIMLKIILHRLQVVVYNTSLKNSFLKNKPDFEQEEVLLRRYLI